MGSEMCIRDRARACVRGLDGRAIGGKCLEAQILGPPSQGEEDLEAGDGPVDGSRGPVREELPPSRVVRVQSGTLSTVPAGRDVHGQVPICREMDDDDDSDRGGRRAGTSAPTRGAMTAVSYSKPTAAAQSSLFATTTSAGGKWRIPDKYKEAVALPKAPGANDRAPRVYVNQARSRGIVAVAWVSRRDIMRMLQRHRLTCCDDCHVLVPRRPARSSGIRLSLIHI